MRILVTNDDGINSEGIHVLAQHLTDLGEVIVFAPLGGVFRSRSRDWPPGGRRARCTPGREARDAWCIRHPRGGCQPTHRCRPPSVVPRALASGQILNVNVPNLPPAGIEGALDTVLSDPIPYSLHSPSLTPTGTDHYAVRFETHGPFYGPDGTDTHAVEAGCVSVTALSSTGPTPPG
ncbi:MAG: hypothetical protein GY713_07090 [Actinomycetia bacterium]|nr:hypothetical protein [Actinomycetes bacterium]